MQRNLFVKFLDFFFCHLNGEKDVTTLTAIKAKCAGEYELGGVLRIWENGSCCLGEQPQREHSSQTGILGATSRPSASH